MKSFEFLQRTVCDQIAFSVFCLVCFFAAGISDVHADFPPPPALPELAPEVRTAALEALESEDYQEREAAQQLLTSGGLATARALPAFFEQAGTEGRVRAIQIVERIYLKLLRHQMDDEALQVQYVMSDLRLLDDPFVGPRLDEFDAIHNSLVARASVRALIRLQAGIEFQYTNRSFPGISRRGFPAELPSQIVLGQHFSGDVEDLRHVHLLLKLGESQLGTGRGVYHIEGCSLPFQAVIDLTAGLPGVSAVSRGKVLLGIASSSGSRFPQPFGNWTIDNVTPASAAHFAGLRIGDTVVRIDNKPVGDYDSFIEDLKGYDVGDVAVLDIIRGARAGQDRPFRIVTLTIPEDKDLLGLKVDPDFGRFVIIDQIDNDSPAAEAGLNRLQRILTFNSQGIAAADQFTELLENTAPGDKITLGIQDMEQVSVQFRGWVGPYK